MSLGHEIPLGSGAPEAAPTMAADLERLAVLVRASLGIDLQPRKSSVVRHRLEGRIRELGLSSLGDYLDLIEGAWAEGERDNLISATTTNVTHFFREAHHFDMLEQEVLPRLVARARAGHRLRIWSAGCSTGQEPFSIAACILDVCPEAAGLDVKVLATDIDPDVIARARLAVYPVTEVEALPQRRRIALFGQAKLDGPMKVRDDIVRLVAFNRLNLVESWPMRHPFDAIFCRNVAIYLEKSVRERLWRRFADVLSEDGLLFIGHSERILGPALGCLDHAGVTAYRRRPGTMPTSLSRN
jgi:chemotaxis protein methyltransferase CheR